MTACIVGWSHGKFGKLDGETSESLVVKAASEAIAHAGIEPRDIDVIYVGNMNGGFVRQEFHSSLALQTSSPPARPAPAPPTPTTRPPCTSRTSTWTWSSTTRTPATVRPGRHRLPALDGLLPAPDRVRPDDALGQDAADSRGGGSRPRPA